MPRAKGKRPRESIQLLPPPVPDLHKILRPSKRRAKDQKHDLGQGIEHLAALTRVIKCRKEIKKR